jgi:acetyltransferase-like isoleucine patch superfamily enzyme
MGAISHWESYRQNIFVTNIFLRVFENSSDELGTGNTRHFRKSIVKFKVYKNQLSRQTGSRNLTGPKNASHNMAYLYEDCDQISDGRDLIFGHKLHIGTPYRGKRFLTRQIPTSCLPKSGGIIGEHNSC